MQALTELWSRCARLDRLPTPDELAVAKALMARPAWRLERGGGHGRAPDGLPAQSQLDRQGLHHRPRLRRRASIASVASRGVLLNIGGDVRVVGEVARTVGVAPPVGDSETAEPIALRRGPRPVGRHERQLPARVPHPRQVVFAHI